MNYSRFLHILNVQYIYCNSDIECIITLLSSRQHLIVWRITVKIILEMLSVCC